MSHLALEPGDADCTTGLSKVVADEVKAQAVIHKVTLGGWFIKAIAYGVAKGVCEAHNDKPILAVDISSEDIEAGYTLVTDGVGGCIWEAPPE